MMHVVFLQTRTKFSTQRKSIPKDAMALDTLIHKTGIASLNAYRGQIRNISE